MKALTICQPYAEMIALGEKTIENRNWPTSYRGPLAIHAGKSRAWMDPDDLKLYPDMSFGFVVALAELVDCVQITRLPAHRADNEHANGPFCWLLENVRRIKPVPAKGAQGLWDWQAAIEF